MLKVIVTENDIAAVEKMNKAEIEDLKSAINASDPHNFLSAAKKTNYVCECGNGLGDSGTGIDVTLEGQTYLYHCKKCGLGGDLIELIATSNGLNKYQKADFMKILAIGANIVGYPLNCDTHAPNIQSARKTQDTKPTATDEKELALICTDIKAAQDNLKNFLDSSGGKFRGLNFGTLSKFGCGFLPQWIHPKTRMKQEQGKLSKVPIPSRRFIIPTPNHYSAIMLPQDRKPDNKSYWKMHAGSKKESFGADFLPLNSDFIIVTEGEIDAMSVWQVTGYDVIATGGAADFKSTIQILQANFSAHKPQILILFDSDDAGRLNAPKLREELLKVGFPAVYKFLSAEGKKDWNDILIEQGETKLNVIISSIVDSAKNDFVNAQAEVLRYAEKIAQSDSLKLSPDKKFDLFCLPHSDYGNSQRLADLFGDKIRFLTDSYHWCIYHDNKWQDSGKENSAISPFARKISEVINANADPLNPIESKLAEKWQRVSTVSNAITMLKGVSSIRITAQDLNTHPHLLNCKNGVVDLQTGKLYPHDSKLLLTQCVNAEYRAGYKNERVDKFLREILPDNETLQAVLRYLGYALTGDCSEEKALFIHGTGGNGKGTLTKTLLNLFDDYGCGFPIEAVLVQPRITKNADACTPAFNKLLWRRLAIAEEIPAQRKLDYAVFKLLTGGDAVPIRKLYEEGAEIKNPTHKFIFSGNHLPELADTHDPGILRRLIVVRFEQDFTGSNRDVTLKKFLQTDEALTALLSLLVDNAVAWYKDGLFISDKMNHERENYLSENDFISEFIEEYCTRGNDKKLPLKDFIKRLKEEYADETIKLSDRTLNKMIQKIPGIIKRKSTGGIFWLYGISWRDTDSTADSSSVNFGGENVDDDDLPF